MRNRASQIIAFGAIFLVACATIPPGTQRRFDMLQRAQDEAYQVVRNIRSFETENPGKRCGECRATYAIARRHVDAYLDQILTDFESKNTSVDSTMYRILGDSVRVSTSRLLAAHDKFLGAQHVSEDSKLFFLELGKAAYPIARDILLTKKMRGRVSDLRWNDFDRIE